MAAWERFESMWGSTQRAVPGGPAFRASPAPAWISATLLGIGIWLIPVAIRAQERSSDPAAAGESTSLERISPRQRQALRENLERELAKLSPGPQADSIRKFLDRLADVENPDRSKSTAGTGGRAADPAVSAPARNAAPADPAGIGDVRDVRQALNEIEFRVALRQYEQYCIQIREIQTSLALLQHRGLTPDQMQTEKASLNTQLQLIKELRAALADEIGEMYETFRGNNTRAAPRESTGNSASLTAICLDEKSAEPLSGVQVVVQRKYTNPDSGKTSVEAHSITKSDQNGKFTIPDQLDHLRRRGVTLRVVFVKSGYDSQEVLLDERSSALPTEIRLARRSATSDDK
ncbi:MAG: hypothetical protein FJ295_21015 [Planctomycetes bacterium]|nr:hypothetical protein [Planctomycetota bacterium]